MKRRQPFSFALFVALPLFLGLPAGAQASDSRVQGGIGQFVSEFRFGSLLHDPASPERGAADIAFQFLLRKPAAVPPAWAMAVPRAMFGGSINTAGRTSHLHAGASWTFDLSAHFFVEASFGAAVHNGDTGNIRRPRRNAMGCVFQFREALGIGYRLERNWSVSATVEHLSNGGRCKQNRGLTNFGIMLGYQF